MHQITSVALKMTTTIKLRVKGIIAILKEKLMSRFHFRVAARTSIIDRSIKSPTIIIFQYWGRPVVVEIIGEIMFVNAKIPVNNSNGCLNVMNKLMIHYYVNNRLLM